MLGQYSGCSSSSYGLFFVFAELATCALVSISSTVEFPSTESKTDPGVRTWTDRSGFDESDSINTAVSISADEATAQRTVGPRKEIMRLFGRSAF